MVKIEQIDALAVLRALARELVDTTQRWRTSLDACKHAGTDPRDSPAHREVSQHRAKAETMFWAAVGAVRHRPGNGPDPTERELVAFGRRIVEAAQSGGPVTMGEQPAVATGDER